MQIDSWEMMPIRLPPESRWCEKNATFYRTERGKCFPFCPAVSGRSQPLKFVVNFIHLSPAVHEQKHFPIVTRNHENLQDFFIRLQKPSFKMKIENATTTNSNNNNNNNTRNHHPNPNRSHLGPLHRAWQVSDQTWWRRCQFWLGRKLAYTKQSSQSLFNDGCVEKSATVQKLRQIPGLLLQDSRLSLEKYDHLRTLTNRMHLQCHLLPSLKLTAISPLKIVHPTPQKETIVFQPSIFRVLCQCHVFFHGG